MNSDGMDETQAIGFAHRMECPYCQTEIVIFHPSERILAASRTCPSCKKEFFIENGMCKTI
jgi:transposase-like protein